MYLFIHSFIYCRLHSVQIGMNPEVPVLDPCLPMGLEDVVDKGGQTVHVRGQGDWRSCAEQLRPLLAGDNSSGSSLSNSYQASIDFTNSEFYGFSEFYYCTDDVLRLGGPYESSTFTRAAQVSMTFALIIFSASFIFLR